MTKAGEWALAAKLGILDVIRNETVTCYNGIPGDGCGTCPACRLRNRGYREFLRAQATKMVGPSGFEPETFCTPSKRATRLRYGPKQKRA